MCFSLLYPTGQDAIQPERKLFNDFYTAFAAAALAIDSGATTHPLTIIGPPQK